MSNHKKSYPYQVGCSRVDITHLKRGVGLLGWGDHDNKAYGVETRLFSRAFVIEHIATKTRWAWVLADICFPTQLLKQKISYRLEAHNPDIEINHNNLCLTATHTHSAPGGFSESMIYNLPNQGVVPVIFEFYVSGIIKSITQASERLESAQIFLGEKNFPPNVPVAFNRSIKAYNQNPEVDKKLDEKDASLAVDREMNLLRFEGKKGPIGSINWFGVHATCIKRNHEVISSDNKGFASEAMEDELRAQFNNPDFVAAFAQSTAGDISPNFLKHRGILETLGISRNDFKNRDISGSLQKNHAVKIFENSTKNNALSGALDFHLHYVDMSDYSIDPEFAQGKNDLKTGEAIFGTRFILGTKEGRGVPKIVEYLVRMVAAIMGRKNTKIHGKKYFLLETKSKRCLGFKNVFALPIPSSIHPMLALIRKFKNKPIIRDLPFVPQIMPIQIITVGSIAIISLPAEPTTMVGRRIKKAIAPILEAKGIHKIIIQGYSNAYSGYITTPEEYEVQNYEGAHTLFGKWTSSAYLSILKKLALDLLKPSDKRSETPSPRPKPLPLKDLVLRDFNFRVWRAQTKRKIRQRFGWRRKK